MTSRFAILLFASALGGACGGNALDGSGDGDAEPSGGASSGATGGQGATAGSGGTVAGSGGVGTGGDSFDDMCRQLFDEASDRFYGEVWDERMSCVVDEDCVWAPVNQTCFGSCGIVSGSNVEGIQEAVDEACQDARDAGCPDPVIPCVDFDYELRCEEGRCGAYAE